MKAPSDAPMRFHQFFARARSSEKKSAPGKKTLGPSEDLEERRPRARRAHRHARTTHDTDITRISRVRHDLGHVDLRPFFREFAD